MTDTMSPTWNRVIFRFKRRGYMKTQHDGPFRKPRTATESTSRNKTLKVNTYFLLCLQAGPQHPLRMSPSVLFVFSVRLPELSRTTRTTQTTEIQGFQILCVEPKHQFVCAVRDVPGVTSKVSSSGAWAVYRLVTWAAAMAGTLMEDSSDTSRWFPLLSICPGERRGPHGSLHQSYRRTSLLGHLA